MRKRKARESIDSGEDAMEAGRLLRGSFLVNPVSSFNFPKTGEREAADSTPAVSFNISLEQKIFAEMANVFVEKFHCNVRMLVTRSMKSGSGPQVMCSHCLTL